MKISHASEVSCRRRISSRRVSLAPTSVPIAPAARLARRLPVKTRKILVALAYRSVCFRRHHFVIVVWRESSVRPDHGWPRSDSFTRRTRDTAGTSCHRSRSNYDGSRVYRTRANRLTVGLVRFTKNRDRSCSLLFFFHRCEFLFALCLR